jgi:hypothetical protein
MFTALALATVLVAQPQPNLKLTNVRISVGELGSPRDNNKFLPGDVLFLSYDIEGLTIDDQGIATYTMAMVVKNPMGRVLFEQYPRSLVDFVPLRGNKVPGRNFVSVGLDDSPGLYTCTLTITDPTTKAEASLSIKYEVLKKDFGIVVVYTSHDQKGELPAPTSGQVGGTLWIQLTIASFERDANTTQPNVVIEFQLYDEKGNAILVSARNEPVPHRHTQDAQSSSPVKAGYYTFADQFQLHLNRPGKFRVEIKATDNVSRKTFTYNLQVTAYAAIGAQNSVKAPDMCETGTPLIVPDAIGCQNSVAVEHYCCAERTRARRCTGPVRLACSSLLAGRRCRILASGLRR